VESALCCRQNEAELVPTDVMELFIEEYSEVYEQVSADIDPGSDDLEDEIESELEAFACMKGLRNNVRSWLVQTK
jgi:hypothetical protein